jgi:hypothetical protein
MATAEDVAWHYGLPSLGQAQPGPQGLASFSMLPFALSNDYRTPDNDHFWKD